MRRLNEDSAVGQYTPVEEISISARLSLTPEKPTWPIDRPEPTVSPATFSGSSGWLGSRGFGGGTMHEALLCGGSRPWRSSASAGPRRRHRLQADRYGQVPGEADEGHREPGRADHQLGRADGVERIKNNGYVKTINNLFSKKIIVPHTQIGPERPAGADACSPRPITRTTTRPSCPPCSAGDRDSNRRQAAHGQPRGLLRFRAVAPRPLPGRSSNDLRAGCRFESIPIPFSHGHHPFGPSRGAIHDSMPFALSWCHC